MGDAKAPHPRRLGGLCLCDASVGLPGAAAQAASFSYTGAEQTYTVPAGVSSVRITAIGGAGGAPPAGSRLPGGRGAIASGIVAVTAGQLLYVYVGGVGGFPAGGYNGGGDGGTTQEGAMSWGGGGASDVSTVPDSAGVASLEARVIVAAGGGGSAGIAAGGGDAGAPGGCCGAAGSGPNAPQPGTQTAGGAGGGCGILTVGCGGSGSLGFGGDGGASGTGSDARAGGGGGGGLYGGGGGAGNISDTSAGAGGSSKAPLGGTLTLAPSTTTAARIDIDPYVAPAPPPRCADGIDDDGDGLIDFPADPGCSSTTDDDETNPATVDKTAPTVRIVGNRSQKLGRIVTVTLECGGAEDCFVWAKGNLSIQGAVGRYALRRAERTMVTRGRRATLKLGIPAKGRAAATRALRRHKKVRATVTATIADAAGNTTTLTRTVRLVR